MYSCFGFLTSIHKYGFYLFIVLDPVLWDFREDVDFHYFDLGSYSQTWSSTQHIATAQDKSVCNDCQNAHPSGVLG